MAERPRQVLRFDPAGCPDCGRRVVQLPRELTSVPDDFDWTARDFEGFRRVMLEDLAAADPERQRWTEADQEVVIVELLAAGLDRASHALDAVFAERFPQTARLPRSLIALLTMVDGIDAAWTAVLALLTPHERDAYGFIDGPAGPALSQRDALLKALSARPMLMEVAREAGLAGLGQVVSLITLEDLRRFIESCPLVAQAGVFHRIEAGQSVYEVRTILAEPELRLHDVGAEVGLLRQAFYDFFFHERDRSIPPGQAVHALLEIDEPALDSASIRTVLGWLVEPLLPIGARLRFVDGARAGIFLRLCVEVAANYFRSEVEMAVRRLLSAEPGAFFDPQDWKFGEPLYQSDLFEALMGLEGVKGVVFSRIRIVGRSGSYQSGVLRPQADEALVLDPGDANPRSGYVVLALAGGRLG
jgi:hypothetical protein